MRAVGGLDFGGKGLAADLEDLVCEVRLYIFLYFIKQM